MAIASTQVAHFGDWEFSSYTTSRGTFFCSILSAVRNQNIGQNIVVKGSPDENNLIIDLYKDEWNWTHGSSVNVMFDFLDNQPLKLGAYGDGHILDVQLPTEVTASFLLELAKQPAVKLIFPRRDEAPWFVASNGARSAVEEMLSCLKTMK